MLYEHHVNTSDYRDTVESFNVVALHSAVKGIDIIVKVQKQYSSELRYLCFAYDVPVPFLPVTGKAEFKLFAKLMLEMSGPFDDEAMAIVWYKLVDGNTVFLKLPVYLRNHHKRWSRNQRARDAVKTFKTDLVSLDAINESTYDQAAAEVTMDDGGDDESGLDVIEARSLPPVAPHFSLLLQQMVKALSPGILIQRASLPPILPRPQVQAFRTEGPPVVAMQIIGLRDQKRSLSTGDCGLWCGYADDI